jgi:hypothetical protein
MCLKNDAILTTQLARHEHNKLNMTFKTPVCMKCIEHTLLGWIRNFAIRNFAKCRRNFVEFREISYFCKIRYCPTSRTLFYSIEHITLKPLLFNKLYANFAVRNFEKIHNISRNCDISAKFRIQPTLFAFTFLQLMVIIFSKTMYSQYLLTLKKIIDHARIWIL